MNERIKELVVESGNGQMRDGRLYPHIGIRFEEDWQRFAELIVKECLKQVRFEVQYEYDWSLADSVSERVLEHFGIEESV